MDGSAAAAVANSAGEVPARGEIASDEFDLSQLDEGVCVRGALSVGVYRMITHMPCVQQHIFSVRSGEVGLFE